MDNDQARGSAQISDELFGKRSEVSKEALKQLMTITRGQGVRLEGWWTRGQPAIDGVLGVVRVRPDQAGTIFQQLMNLPTHIKVEGFPVGILNPDLVELRFSTPGERR